MEKPILRFREDGHFRILEVSDFHAGDHYNPKLTTGLDVLLEETKPDFVMIGGDQCVHQMTVEGARDYFAEIIEPITRRGLPFATIFGNHDREAGMPLEEQEKAFEAIPGCLSERGPETIHGIGNYRIPILSHEGDDVPYAIWAMDSHREITDLPGMFGRDPACKRSDFILSTHVYGDGNGGMPVFDQILWYYSGSKEMEAKCGHKVPGVMFMHIPLPEYALFCENPEECHARGNKRDSVGCSEINFGLFAAAYERGDIKGFFFGHEHLNDLQVEHLGITLACDAALGYNMSCHDDMRGGRIIDLYENGEMHTRMIRLIDLLGQDAMRDPDYFEGGCPYFIRKL